MPSTIRFERASRPHPFVKSLGGLVTRPNSENIGADTFECRESLEFLGRTGFSSTASTATSRQSACATRECRSKVLAPARCAGLEPGFSTRELNEIRPILVEREPTIIEARHEHCDQHRN